MLFSFREFTMQPLQFSAQIAFVPYHLFDKIMRQAGATKVAVEIPYSYINRDQFVCVDSGFTENIYNCTAMALPNTSSAVLAHLYPDDQVNQQAVAHLPLEQGPLFKKIQKNLGHTTQSAVIVGAYAGYQNTYKSKIAQALANFLLTVIQQLAITPSYFLNPNTPNLKLGYVGKIPWLNKLFRTGTLEDTVIIGMNQVRDFSNNPAQVRKNISLAFNNWGLAPQDKLVFIDNDLNVTDVP